MKVASWLDQHLGLLVSHSVTIAAIIVFALVARALVARLINRVVNQATAAADTRAGRLLEGSLLLASERRRQRTRAIGSVLRSLSSAAILTLAVLMVISALDIPTAPILASASVIGVAVGFGARNLVTDFVSGIFMILEDQYGVGDVIDVGDATGTVEEIGLRVTRLRDAEGIVWYVRNGTINRVGNVSQGWGHASVDVAINYTEDLDRVRDVLSEVAGELHDDTAWRPRLLDEKPVVSGLESFGNDQIVMRIEARTPPDERTAVERELRRRIKMALDAAGVTPK